MLKVGARLGMLTRWGTKRPPGGTTGSVEAQVEPPASHELLYEVDQAYDRGMLGPADARMLRYLLRAGQLRAHDVMTPKHLVSTVSVTQTVGDAVSGSAPSDFSRLVVLDPEGVEPAGYVDRDELVLFAARGEVAVPIGRLLKVLPRNREDQSLVGLFETMLKRRLWISQCRDASGAYVGIVTVEDVVETLLGTEMLGGDATVQELRELAQLLWRQRMSDRGIPA